MKAISHAAHHIQKSLYNLLIDVRTHSNVQINPHSTSWREGPDRRMAFAHLFCFSCCGPVNRGDTERVPRETTGAGWGGEDPRRGGSRVPSPATRPWEGP